MKWGVYDGHNPPWLETLRTVKTLVSTRRRVDRKAIRTAQSTCNWHDSRGSVAYIQRERRRGPLCEFLGKPIPDGKPFPNVNKVNDAAGLQELRQIFIIATYIWIPLTVAIFFIFPFCWRHRQPTTQKNKSLWRRPWWQSWLPELSFSTGGAWHSLPITDRIAAALLDKLNAALFSLVICPRCKVAVD